MSEDVLYVNLDVLMSEYTKKLDLALEKMGTFGKKAKKESKTWSEGLEDVAKRYVALLTVEKAYQAIAGTFKLEEKYKALLMPLENVTKANGEFGSSLQFIKDLADETGQDVFVLGGAYKNMYAAATQAGMATSQLDLIYSSIVKAGASLRLSNDEVSLSLKAIEQMMNKGTIGSEELKKQLGDHLPGAFGTMAAAAKDAGISVTGSTQELIKLMDEGKVASNLVLPFFAKRLEEAFGANANANVNTISGSANRLGNEFVYLVHALDEGKVIGFWASFQNGIADTFKSLNGLIKYGGLKDLWEMVSGGKVGSLVVNARMSGLAASDNAFSNLPRIGQLKEIKRLQKEIKDENSYFQGLVKTGYESDTGFKHLEEKIAQLNRFLEIAKKVNTGSNGGVPPLLGGSGATKAIKDYSFEMKLLALKAEHSKKEMDAFYESIERSKSITWTPGSLENTGQINADKLDFFNQMAKAVGFDGEGSSELLKNAYNELIHPLGLAIEDSEIIMQAIKKLGINMKDGFSTAEMDSVMFFVDKMQGSLADATAMIDGFLQQSFTFLSDTFSTGFASIFNTKIDFKKSFKPILASFMIGLGDMITQMGQKMLIAAIAKDTAIKALASFLGAGIPAAVALIGIGSALKGGGMAMNSNSSLSSSTAGSNYSGGGGYSNYSNFNRGQGSQSMPKAINIVFENGALKGYMNYQDRKYNG